MSLKKCMCQLSIIASLLAMSGGSCPNTTQPTLPGGITGTAAAGQAKYIASCAACHSLGAFDTTTASGGNDLKGKGDNTTTNLGGINAAMTGITLTAQEVADLKAFIATIQ